MKLTNENYFSPEANRQYVSVSQFKTFCDCEARAMAELNGKYERKSTTALLVGSYVDAHFEGTLDLFRAKNPEIFKRDGNLKADYVQAEEIISRIEQDKLFMEYMSGKKQLIFTAELFGTPWKIKVDSQHEDKIVDLKCMRSLERIMGKSFVEHWQYDVQMAVYSEVERRWRENQEIDATLSRKPTYLAVATKEPVTNLEIIHIPDWHHDETLEYVKK